MQKNVSILYHADPIDPDTKTYNYTVTLEPDKSENYFTGKEIQIQMQAIANALKEMLPSTATIVSINNVDMHVIPVGVLINTLMTNDDHLASILFAKDKTNIEAEHANKDIAQAEEPSEDKNATINSTNIVAKEHESMTTETKTKSPHIINVQTKKGGSYVPFDLNSGKEPQDDNKINSIGRSQLSYNVFWKDAKDIIERHKDVIFTAPIGMVPETGNITARRITAFSRNCGLANDALKDYQSSVLDMIKDTKGAIYKIWIFNKPGESVNESMPESTEDHNAVNEEKKIDDSRLNKFNQLDDLINNIRIDYIDKLHENEKLEASKNKIDIEGLPDEIINMTKEPDIKKRAAYLFNLINQIGMQSYDASLAPLASDPKLFLKAVNALSCQNK